METSPVKTAFEVCIINAEGNLSRRYLVSCASIGHAAVMPWELGEGDAVFVRPVALTSLNAEDGARRARANPVPFSRNTHLPPTDSSTHEQDP